MFQLSLVILSMMERIPGIGKYSIDFIWCKDIRKDCTCFGKLIYMVKYMKNMNFKCTQYKDLDIFDIALRK